MSDPLPVYLTRGYVAYVSPEDADLVEPFRWRASVRVLRHAGTVVGERVYARRSATLAERELGWPDTVYLHRWIAGNVPHYVVDHISGNPLDNTRENLRIATYQENSQNSWAVGGVAGFRGVTEVKGRRTRYRARLGSQSLGNFVTATEAARAYDRAALQLLGPFAALNFPLSDYYLPLDTKWVVIKRRPQLTRVSPRVRLFHPAPSEPPF